MLSETSCSLPSASTPHPEEDTLAPLDFDDLLDIARELEFTRTITHIWPCEEDPGAGHETELDEILAAIVSMPNAGESPPPLVSSAPSTTIDPVHVPEIDLNESAPAYPEPDANATIPKNLLSLAKGTDQVRAGTIAPITSTLSGWSPPNGYQFLDLDDSLVFPQPATDMWSSPWLAMFLATSSTEPISDRSPTTAPAVGDSQSQASAMAQRPPSASTADKTANDLKKGNLQSSITEPVHVRSALQTSSNVASQPVATSRAKASRSRPRPPLIAATSGVSTANHARAPRGGIPPHIARSVTKANILRVEKERKAIQDSFPSASSGEARKPSVLQRGANVTEREASKWANGGVGGKKSWDENDEKGGRATKRARV